MTSTIRQAALLLAIPASLAAQQPTTLRVSPQQGQTLRFSTLVETWVNLTSLGATMDTVRATTALTIYTTRTVMQVRADTAIIRDVIDSARAATPAIPGMTAADKAAAATAMRGLTTFSAIDGRGVLLDYAGAQTMGQMSAPLQSMMPMAGLLRAVFAFPVNPVRAGETWSETLSSRDADGSLTLSATFTLTGTQARGSHSVAMITLTGQMGGGGPNGALAMRASGNLEFDMTDSQPVRFVTDLQGQLSTSTASVPIRVRRTVVRL